MATTSGRQTSPARPLERRRGLPPFTRLARAHATSAAGEGAVAIALAGSLFFSLDYEAARWRVVLYLLLTLLPFTVVAPLIGPAIDRLRGGARWIMIGTCAVRCVMAFLMIGHIDTYFLFPEAFTLLVMAKGYQVAKSAYLPTVVASDAQLVASNSKLAVLSALAAVVGGGPATLATKLGGASWAVGVATGWYAVATIFALQITAVRLRDIGAPSDQERAELSSAGVRVASSAMGLLRGSVGFLTLWIAFELRARNASPVEFGLVLGPLGAGAIVGAGVAPRLRRLISEEWMLGGALVVTAAAGTLSALIGGLAGAALITAGVALVSASAKLAFDSLVQRDAPNADHGRAFAAYEARFQLLWVVGALCGVLLPFPLRLGFATVAVLAIATGALFALGRRAIAAGSAPPKLTDVVLRVMSDPVVAPAGAAAPPAGGAGAAGAASVSSTAGPPVAWAPPSGAPAPWGPPSGTSPADLPAPWGEAPGSTRSAGMAPPGPGVYDELAEPTRPMPAVPPLPDGDDPTTLAPPPGHDPRRGWR
jgi:hypothetical protein